jgi:hypothetical protein
MKKTLLICLVSMLPCLAFAQDEAPVLKDFSKNSQDITKTIQINDHLNVVQIDNNNKNFDLVAVNNNMQIIWRTTITGYGISIGKFKDKIAVVAATEHGTFKGNGNTYEAFIIDPVNGNILNQKIIYQDNDNYVEIPKVLIGDNYFKFSIRQTAITRQMHVGIPVLYIFQVISWSKEANETVKLKMIDIDEKLDKVDSVNALINGIYITSTCNKNGDTFISWLNGPAIEVYKYENGKSDPVMQLNADIDIKTRDDSQLENIILFKASVTKPDYLFYTLLYLNKNRDQEMMLGKMDFSTNTKQSITRVFKKDDIKAIEKSFVPVNKKIDDADLGPPKLMSMKAYLKTDNDVIVTMQGSYTVSSTGGGSYIEIYSVLITAYDDNLQQKFTQLIPINYRDQGVGTEGYTSFNNKLYIVGDTRKDTFYGDIDLNTGQWDKLNFLSKKNVKGVGLPNHILWYGNNFIIPYGTSVGWGDRKEDIMLQQQQY